MLLLFTLFQQITERNAHKQTLSLSQLISSLQFMILSLKALY